MVSPHYILTLSLLDLTYIWEGSSCAVVVAFVNAVPAAEAEAEVETEFESELLLMPKLNWNWCWGWILGKIQKI